MPKKLRDHEPMAGTGAAPGGAVGAPGKRTLTAGLPPGRGRPMGLPFMDVLTNQSDEESPDSVRERAREVAGLGICDEEGMQGTLHCPLDESVRAKLRTDIADTLIVGTMNWANAVQDESVSILIEAPEGVGPIVDILVSLAFGKITGFIAAVGKSGETTGGEISIGKHVRDIAKELTGAVKSHSSSNLKKSTGDPDRDDKLSFLAAIEPIADTERKHVMGVVMKLGDSALVTVAEQVAALDLSKATFAAAISATLERFKAQVLSVGQGTRLEGTSVAWIRRADGARRAASVARGTRSTRYRNEDYATASGTWRFVQWLDEDMQDGAIARSTANRREVHELAAPNHPDNFNLLAATMWEEPHPAALTEWCGS